VSKKQIFSFLSDIKMQQPNLSTANNTFSNANLIPKSPQSSPPYLNLQTFQSYIDLLTDKETNDETKLKAAQELSNNFEVILEKNKKQLKFSLIF
jgi:hypothetical protein